MPQHIPQPDHPHDPAYWLARIAALPHPKTSRLRIMNVCGGHERTITHAGLRQVLPDYLQVIPGPGCPVCVCPETDIQAAVALSLRPDVILATFGDMVRVPGNAMKGKPRSLQDARVVGGHVSPIAAPADVLALARQFPDKQIVFFAAGFETTAAPLAALLTRPDLPGNLTILLSARQTWPAIDHLLQDEDPGFDALIAPGHVATVMGARQWAFVAERHGLPTVVAGFTPALLLQAIHAALAQVIARESRLVNAYPQCVTDEGNARARHLMDRVFDTIDAPWRGIGTFTSSGYALRPALAAHDARERFPEAFSDDSTLRMGMPAGCDCAAVVLGRITPSACRLFGTGCHPDNPVGPCMVSDEGACRIWWQSGEPTANRQKLAV